MTAKLRILLAEDHLIVREGIKLLINSQPDMEVVGEADNGEIVVSKAQDLVPDIIFAGYFDAGSQRVESRQKTQKTLSAGENFDSHAPHRRRLFAAVDSSWS